MSKQPPKQDQASIARREGLLVVKSHPLFSPLFRRIYINDTKNNNRCPENGWGVVSSNGAIHLHPRRRGERDEWARIVAHLALHLGFAHIREEANPEAWAAACDVVCNRFLREMKFGKQPEQLCEPDGTEGFGGDERRLYERFVREGIPDIAKSISPAGIGTPSFYFDSSNWQRDENWSRLIAEGMRRAVSGAVQVAAGLADDISGACKEKPRSKANRAMAWVVEHFPLLGALASAFALVEDPRECIVNDISIAAIDVSDRKIFINPAAGLSEQECRLVIIHELLHAGLEHSSRRNGRDHFLWNAACDYVINGWIVEMGIGALPSFGLLYDASLKGKSADEIYQMLVSDIRRSRKLCTFRGKDGLGDILDDGPKVLVDGQSADRFCREALARGLELHQSVSRGTVPAGLEQEIRALMQPPIPWDVELARWFDIHFPLPEKRRTYARPSRRQGSTPDIPRPRSVPMDEAQREGRVFGVVLDTSGSMNVTLLGKALGSIAAYSYAHEVAAVRVVFCDAEYYDAGYMMPDEIAHRVRVKGRGGTVLQPGVDFICNASDFPKDAPLLIITDAECDKVNVGREHAWLIPNGRTLPFIPAGQVFHIK